jgi:hypothetical protein
LPFEISGKHLIHPIEEHQYQAKTDSIIDVDRIAQRNQFSKKKENDQAQA